MRSTNFILPLIVVLYFFQTSFGQQAATAVEPGKVTAIAGDFPGGVIDGYLHRRLPAYESGSL